MREQKYVHRGLFFGGGLFPGGRLLCYFLLMPVALSASQMYSNWLGFGATQWRAEDYIGFICKFMLGMGLGFELPVVLLTLVKIGVLLSSLRAMALHDRDRVGLGRIAHHAGGDHASDDGRPAISALRDQRVDRPVLGMAGSQTAAALDATTWSRRMPC